MLENKINGFIDYCKVAGFSNKSIETFSIRLKDFNKFLKSKRFSYLRSVKYTHLSTFVAKYGKPSVHVKKSRIWALRLFFHYLTLKGYLAENIATQLPYPKIESTVPQFLTINEFNRILHHCAVQASTLMGLRNLNIILLLGLLGLRSGAIVALDVRDIDVVSGLARVKEKGGRKSIMILPEIICATLHNYLEKRGNRQGSLFLTKREKRISARSLQDIFRSTADACSIDKHLHSHLFRHTAGTHLNRVAGTTITQHVLGHSLRKNTYKYVHLNPDNYATYMRKHPFMKL